MWRRLIARKVFGELGRSLTCLRVCSFGGYITAAALRRLLGSDVAGRAAVCGPPGFNKSMNDILKQELAVENVRLL